MEVIRLPNGQDAPKDADCVCIERGEDGRFYINATALLDCGDTEEAESVSMIGSAPYDSYDEAEAAGLAWADAHCAGTVHIATHL